jgi:hypothetical protein
VARRQGLRSRHSDPRYITHIEREDDAANSRTRSALLTVNSIRLSSYTIAS